MTVSLFIDGLALAIWTYLIIGHGRFWRAAERDDGDASLAEPASWPRVVAVVPARNEAEAAPYSIASLMAQDYPGDFSIILVDDNSEDETTAAVSAVARCAAGKITILPGGPMVPGWTGKLWAIRQGIERVERLTEPPKYLLLTDADIVHAPHGLRRLVARAEARGLVLTSLMVRLRCETLAERALIPAFVFFFQMLYPFAWVNRRDYRTAGAAGGCMLVERESLAASGGIAAIRDALIDDCALAMRLKAHGPVWLGLTNRAESIRPYPAFKDVRNMIVRSAYAQLNYSPFILLGTVLGLAVIYLAAPLLVIFCSGPARLEAIVPWALMGLAFIPTLRFYRRSPLWAPLLPAIAAVYIGFTLNSAYQHLRGRGGIWKGRAQAPPRGGR